MGRAKRKGVFEDAQNALIEIIQRIRKVSSGHLFSTDIFYSVEC